MLPGIVCYEVRTVAVDIENSSKALKHILLGEFL